MNSLVTVDFHGDTIFAVKQDDEVYVALKPICERLGVKWEGQRQRVNRDAVLAEGACILQVPWLSGPQEATYLRLDLLNGWLFGISENSIRDAETRERVLAYKRECYRVLYEHFHPQPAEPVGLLLDWQEMDAKVRLVRETRLTRGRRAAQLLWTKLGLPEPEKGKRPPPEPMPERGRAYEQVELIAVISRFLSECTAPKKANRVKASELFWLYCRWAGENDAPTLSHKRFGGAMPATGVKRLSSNGHWYVGLEIKQDAWRGSSGGAHLPQS